MTTPHRFSSHRGHRNWLKDTRFGFVAWFTEVEIESLATEILLDEEIDGAIKIRQASNPSRELAVVIVVRTMGSLHHQDEVLMHLYVSGASLASPEARWNRS